MCGIIGYQGKNSVVPILLDGLKSLEYRGYDSAGIAILENNKTKIIKAVGKVANLEKKIDRNLSSQIGIAHTRWATHGGVCDENAHPHHQGVITLVHNGIIENYVELKNKLLKKKYTFKGQTDSEVLCAFIDMLYKENKDMLKTISIMQKEAKGSYALLILNEKEPDKVYATRCNSPLIVSHTPDGIYFASDVPAIIKYTKKYYLLDNNDIVVAHNNIEFYDKDLNKVAKKEEVFDKTTEEAQKGEYKHFMLKEINDEPKVIRELLNYYVKNNKFNDNMPNFKKYNKIFIVGCGSAYYTGEIAKTIFEKYVNIPVYCYLASEYRYQKNFYDKNTLVIFISQSGETADTLEALRKTKEDGVDTLAIVNVYASSIAREADKVLYIKAGVEIAVATTKAFVAQVCLLSFIAIKMAGKEELLKYFTSLDKEIKKLIELDYKPIAKHFYKSASAFFIGRGIDYGLCEEGSLKLKEISYINSSAFPAGELKHGTISLIEENTPVVAITSNPELKYKTISNAKEVKARGAYLLYITNDKEKDKFYDDVIEIKHIHEIVDSIMMVIPLQMLAYHVALLKKLDIDKPRNLAKSVTVE